LVHNPGLSNYKHSYRPSQPHIEIQCYNPKGCNFVSVFSGLKDSLQRHYKLHYSSYHTDSKKNHSYIQIRFDNRQDYNLEYNVSVNLHSCLLHNPVRSNLHRISEHRRQQIQQAEIQKTIDIENFQKKKAEMRERINGTEPVRFNPFGNLKTIGPHPLKFTVGIMGNRRPAGEHKPINVTAAKDHPVIATATATKDRPVTVAKGHTKWLI